MVTPEEIREQAMVFVRAGDELTASLLRDLASQVESLQADADRYRWMRDCSLEKWENVCEFSGAHLDAAIDEARKQS